MPYDKTNITIRSVHILAGCGIYFVSSYTLLAPKYPVPTRTLILQVCMGTVESQIC